MLLRALHPLLVFISILIESNTTQIIVVQHDPNGTYQ